MSRLAMFCGGLRPLSAAAPCSLSRWRRWIRTVIPCVARLARIRLTEKMMTASEFSGYLPIRSLVNGITEIVNRKMKFRAASPSCSPRTPRKTCRWSSQN
jgi:hypothetical protein